MAVSGDASQLDYLVMAEEHGSIVHSPMFGNITEVFKGIANLGNVAGEADVMDKAELVRAHGGDYKLFEKLDADSDGYVTLDEWLKYLSERRQKLEEKKVGKGDDWIRTLVSTLEMNLKILLLDDSIDDAENDKAHADEAAKEAAQERAEAEEAAKQAAKERLEAAEAERRAREAEDAAHNASKSANLEELERLRFEASEARKEAEYEKEQAEKATQEAEEERMRAWEKEQEAERERKHAEQAAALAKAAEDAALARAREEAEDAKKEAAQLKAEAETARGKVAQNAAAAKQAAAEAKQKEDDAKARIAKLQADDDADKKALAEAREDAARARADDDADKRALAEARAEAARARADDDADKKALAEARAEAARARADDDADKKALVEAREDAARARADDDADKKALAEARAEAARARADDDADKKALVEAREDAARAKADDDADKKALAEARAEAASLRKEVAALRRQLQDSETERLHAEKAKRGADQSKSDAENAKCEAELARYDAQKAKKALAESESKKIGAAAELDGLRTQLERERQAKALQKAKLESERDQARKSQAAVEVQVARLQQELLEASIKQPEAAPVLFEMSQVPRQVSPSKSMSGFPVMRERPILVHPPPPPTSYSMFSPNCDGGVSSLSPPQLSSPPSPYDTAVFQMAPVSPSTLLRSHLPRHPTTPSGQLLHLQLGPETGADDRLSSKNKIILAPRSAAPAHHSQQLRASPSRASPPTPPHSRHSTLGNTFPSTWVNARVLAACQRPASGHLSVAAVLASASTVLFGESVSPSYLAFEDLTLRRIVNRRITNSGASLIANVDNDQAYMALLHRLEVGTGDIANLFTEGLRLPSGALGTAEVSYFLKREDHVVWGPAGTIIPEQLDAAGFDWLWDQLKRLVSDERNVMLYREADHLTTISGYIAQPASGGEEGETHFVMIAEHEPAKAPTVMRLERFVDVLRSMFASPHAAVMILRRHGTVTLSPGAAAVSPLHPVHILTDY